MIYDGGESLNLTQSGLAETSLNFFLGWKGYDSVQLFSTFIFCPTIKMLVVINQLKRGILNYE
jgi:hypothetical protein